MTSNRLIDLFSDTATRPSPGMRKAMAEAEVGDEQKAEDPTTNALQERVAALLGKEAAVFLPSGTMCNQIALLVHCRPGDEVIAADVAHIFTSEAGGGSALCRRADLAAGDQARHLQRRRGRRGRPRRQSPQPALAPGRRRADRQPRRRRRVAARRPSRRWRPRRGAMACPCTWTAPASSMPWSPAALPPSAWRRPATAPGSICRRGWAARSAACSRARRPSSTRRGGGSTAWAARCANRACSPPPASTRSTTTSSAWPRTTATPGDWRRCSATWPASAS